jgi:hypothetical protein
MLRDDVVDAVANGQFHVYPIESIDQGIELLTGVEAGRRTDEGLYPFGTVNFLVQERLREMARKQIELSQPSFLKESHV